MLSRYGFLTRFASCAFADVLPQKSIMDNGIRPLWQDISRIAGPAFTVTCPPGDNLMFHAAIYRASPGSIIVANAGDVNYAVAGGNVCAVAARRGIKGFIIDGAIRDIAEIRKLGFPVFARGLMPKPGGKAVVQDLEQTIQCGGVDVNSGDIVVADEDGIVVIPQAEETKVFESVAARAKKEENQSLDDWEASHHNRIQEILQAKGFKG